MSVDLASKKIIMIHGLASKPPPDFTHQLWRKSLIENIRVSNRQLARNLDADAEVFESAYWANVVPHHIPDDSSYYKKLQLQVDKVIDERREIKDGFHVGTKEKVGGFFKDLFSIRSLTDDNKVIFFFHQRPKSTAEDCMVIC